MTVIKVSRGQYTSYDVILKTSGQYEVDANFDLNDNTLLGVGLIQGTTTTNQIDDTVSGWDYKVGSGSVHDFYINGVIEYTMSNTALDLLANFLSGVGLIQGVTTTNQIDDITTGWDIKVGSGHNIDFYFNSALNYSFNSLNVDFMSNILKGIAVIEGATTTNKITSSGAGWELEINGAGDVIAFHNGSSQRIKYEFDNDDFSPVDNVASLGKSGRRWVDVWAVNGTIQTSFSKFKKNITKFDIQKCCDVINAIEPIEFEWKDEQFKNAKTAKKQQYIGKKYVGINADPLKTFLPQACAGDDGIYTSSINAVLVGAVKYLMKEVESLKSQIPK